MLCNNKMAKRILSAHVCLLLRKLRCMYRVLFYTHNVHGGDESNNHGYHFYFYVTQKKKRLHVFINIAVYIFRADRQCHLLGCPFLSLSKSKNGLINMFLNMKALNKNLVGLPLNYLRINFVWLGNYFG